MNINKVMLGVLVALLMVQPLVSTALAEEEGWLVAGLEGGAWKSSERDPSVRTAVHPGDVVRPNEKIETFQDHRVTLALGADGKNLVTAQGSVRIQRDTGATRFQLERGRALAVLDDLEGRGDFSITTPVGVASVRGTRFAVTVPAGSEEMGVQTFRGEVLVRAGGGRNARSRSVVLAKDGKVTASKSGKGPLSIEALSEKDWKEYRGDYRAVRAARENLRTNGERWSEDSKKPESSRWVPALESDGAVLNTDAKNIVF